MKKYRVTKCKGLVKKILTEYPDTRDCDMKLTARLWLSECAFKNINYDKILEHVFNRRVTSPTSIIRVRRLLQNDHEELRGSKYNLRQDKFERDTKEDLGYGT